MTPSTFSKRSGFTLIELLLVVGIIAILASIVIVAVNPTKQLTAARDSGRKSTANELQKGMIQYSIDNNGRFPGDKTLPTTEEDAIDICAPGVTAEASCTSILNDIVPTYLALAESDVSEADPLLLGYTAFNDKGHVTVTPKYLTSTAIAFVDTGDEGEGGGACVEGYFMTGDFPSAILVVGSKAYVANRNGQDITVVNTTTDTVIDTISIGGEPVWMASVGSKLYVTNEDDDTVVIVDTATDTVSDTIGGFDQPRYMTLVGSNLYVTNNGDSTVKVLNTSTDTVTDSIETETGPGLPIVSGTKLFVPNYNSGEVTVINTSTNELIQHVDLIGADAVNPTTGVVVGGFLYMGNDNPSSEEIYKINVNTLSATAIDVGTQPAAVAAVGSDLFVGSRGGDEVLVVDTGTDTVDDTIATGDNPYGMKQAGTFLYVSSYDGLYVINPSNHTIAGPIFHPSPGMPVLVGGKVYIPSSNSAQVSIYDASTGMQCE